MTVHHARVGQLDLFTRWCAIALSALIAFFVIGCASGPKVVDHAFGFNAPQDSPQYEVLAYKYGDGKVVSTSSDVSIRQFGVSKQGSNVNGPMPLGDRLYVKWHEKATSQVYEESVDLRPLLPSDMTDRRIYFVVDRSQLYVYLMDLKRRADPKAPIVGPFKLQYFVTSQIYPR